MENSIFAVPIIKETCVMCGACIRFCPVDAIRLGMRRAVIQEELCIGCGRCVHRCFQGAICIPTHLRS